MLVAKRIVQMVAMFGLIPLAVWAGDDPATPAADKPAETKQAEPVKAASAEDLGKLIDQLDADRFTERQQASEKLAAIGKPAIEALAKAAVGDSLEVTTRAITVLGKLLESSDQATKDAAKTALEGIAKSDKPSAARRAQELVQPKAAEQPAGGAVGGGVVVVQAQIGGAGTSKRSMKNINGVKEIEAEEDGKKVKIVDDPQKGIKIEHTYKKDDKEVTDKYEAKDAKELEKKHPEGHKLYKKYSEEQQVGGLGGIQLQIQGGGLQILPGQPLQLPGFQPALRAGRVETATRLMETLGKQIESLTKDLKDAPQDAKDSLKKQVDELKKQLGDLEKKLEEK